jgi:glycosyltransferase involved in cell wall biosynthesis
MKVLILTVDFNIKGGVSGYYSIAKKYFKVDVEYFIVGSRYENKNLFYNIYRLISDYIKFIYNINRNNYDLIHLNPSFNFKGFSRDLVFLLLSKFAGNKVIIFIHGWSKQYERLFNIIPLVIKSRLLNLSDCIIVLSKDFKNKLMEWGYFRDIYVSSTKVDNDLLKGIDVNVINNKHKNNQNITLLFFSRVEKYKGIYEVIDAFKIIQNKYNNIRLIIAGSGKETESVQMYLKNNRLSNVSIVGFITGENKRQLLLNSDIYILPTYGEGMPTTVIEAMAFGLPVITRRVGGLKDMFLDGQMGFITDENNADVLIENIETLIKNPLLRKQMSLYNYRYIKNNFYADKVISNIEKIYRNVLGNLHDEDI